LLNLLSLSLRLWIFLPSWPKMQRLIIKSNISCNIDFDLLIQRFLSPRLVIVFSEKENIVEVTSNSLLFKNLYIFVLFLLFSIYFSTINMKENLSGSIRISQLAIWIHSEKFYWKSLLEKKKIKKLCEKWKQLFPILIFILKGEKISIKTDHVFDAWLYQFEL
jgi:hypothetical protein